MEPWRLRETALGPDSLAHSESLFALSNGYLGMRGNLDEGEPHGIPGTYLAGVYDVRPMPYAEPAYDYPELTQELVNVTDGSVIRLLVGDEPLDVRAGSLEAHERVLDFRSGVLDRCVEWTSASGQRVRVHSRRLVSLTLRGTAAVC